MLKGFKMELFNLVRAPKESKLTIRLSMKLPRVDRWSSYWWTFVKGQPRDDGETREMYRNGWHHSTANSPPDQQLSVQELSDSTEDSWTANRSTWRNEYLWWFKVPFCKRANKQQLLSSCPYVELHESMDELLECTKLSSRQHQWRMHKPAKWASYCQLGNIESTFPNTVAVQSLNWKIKTQIDLSNNQSV